MLLLAMLFVSSLFFIMYHTTFVFVIYYCYRSIRRRVAIANMLQWMQQLTGVICIYIYIYIYIYTYIKNPGRPPQRGTRAA